MKTIELKKMDIGNGEILGYRECGKGDKILIFVHGNMTSSKHWDLVMESLMDDYKIFAVDLRGFGVSSYNNTINSLKDFSEDIKLFVDNLQLKAFSMIGWSTGGGVVMQFSIDYPEYLEKMILVESVGISGYPIFKKDENFQPILTELLETKEEIAKDPIQVLPVLNALANKDKEFYRNLWNLTIYTKNKPSDDKYEEYLCDMLTQRNLVDVDYALTRFNISDSHNGIVEGTGEINKIKTPTLVIQGDRDLVVPRQYGEDIAKAIGENAELVVLEDSGHSPLIDSFDRLITLIREFI